MQKFVPRFVLVCVKENVLFSDLDVITVGEQSSLINLLLSEVYKCNTVEEFFVVSTEYHNEAIVDETNQSFTPERALMNKSYCLFFIVLD